MTLTPELEEAFNAQITMEYAAAYSYLGMSTWLETQGLPGMASWLRMQSDEETTHGLRLLQFVLDRGGKVELGQIDAPSVDLETPIDAVTSLSWAREARNTSIGVSRSTDGASI